MAGGGGRARRERETRELDWEILRIAGMRVLTSHLPLLPRLIQALHLQKQRLVVNLHETEGGRAGGREEGREGTRKDGIKGGKERG